MQTEWLNFLNNAVLNSAAFSATSEFICPTEHLGLIYVEGEDALSFLQNQLSNDIAKIDEDTCQLNSYSSHKGRMYSIFYVIKYDDGYLMIVPKSQINFLLQRLQMFVIMAKVRLSDITNKWAKMGYQSAAIAANELNEAAQVKLSNGTLFIRLNPHNPNRVLVLSAFSSAQALWNFYKNNLTICSTNAWQLAEINEGIPSLSPETSEAFVLQMTNLQLLNGVSFKKGCFPGQEIVARTKYLGKTKRRMYLASIKSNVQPLAIEELCDLTSDSADGSGKVVASAKADENHFNFLFVANIKKAEAHSLKLVRQENIKLIIKNLPYSYEE